MFITNQSFSRAKIEVSLDEHGLCLQGSEPMPKRVLNALHEVANDLGYTPQEHDKLISYAGDMTLWRVLQSITTT